MKTYYFLFATLLCLVYSCKSDNSIEGAWSKTIGNQTLYVYEIKGLIGFQIQDHDDEILDSGLLDFVNDSVCNIYSRAGKKVGKSTFHSTIEVGETQAMFIEGYFGDDFWSKRDYVKDENEKAIKAFLSVILPEIENRRNPGN